MSNKNAKSESRLLFFVPLLVLTLLCATLLLLNHAFTKHRLLAVYRDADYELAGMLGERFPELSEEEIIRLLNHRDRNKKEIDAKTDVLFDAYAKKGKDLLSAYGYNEAYQSPRANKILVQSGLTSFFIVLSALTGLTAVFYLRYKRRTEEIDEIADYVRKLNEKNYDLLPSDNTEEGLSILKNEIYKTTVMLREIAENKTEETKRLSSSLEDISHQLRTPLASINIMIDNILDDPDMPPELRGEFLNDISGQVTWISELVNSLLTLAKFDAGTIVMKQEEIDARELIADAEKRLGILLDVRDVHVVHEDSENGEEAQAPVLFVGDYKWQLEALSNIIKNCAEHSPAGARLYLSAEQNSIYTKITVRDEGEGISNEDLRHIFERFYKAKNSRPESIGIGLSLAKSIVETGHGFITVDSEEGKGSTFEIKYMR